METRRLLVGLSEAEVLDKGAELARTMGEVDTIELERQGMQSTAKAKIKELKTRIGDLADQVRTRSEYREVPCTWERDDPKKMMRLRRDDTGECVESRPMEEDELQAKLFDANEERTKRRGKGAKAAASGETPVE